MPVGFATIGHPVSVCHLYSTHHITSHHISVAHTRSHHITHKTTHTSGLEWECRASSQPTSETPDRRALRPKTHGAVCSGHTAKDRCPATHPPTHPHTTNTIKMGRNRGEWEWIGRKGWRDVRVVLFDGAQSGGCSEQRLHFVLGDQTPIRCA
jgi:hypothetical protein